MSDDDFHARLVDFTEHPLVLLVDTEGNAELIGENTLCPIRTAAGRSPSGSTTRRPRTTRVTSVRSPFTAARRGPKPRG